MKILPDREQGRPLAIGLAAIVLIMAYMLGFHWFVERHRAISGEQHDLKQQIARFKATAEQRPRLEAQLGDLRAARHDSALFLPESGFSPAAAGLNRRLREIITAQADDESFCQVISSQNSPARDPERFEQVMVNVRMNCPLQDFVRVLHALEDGIPLTFVDNVTIMQRAAPQRRGGRGPDPALLDIRFSMYGYLTERGGR